jgi:hypothetical protein
MNQAEINLQIFKTHDPSGKFGKESYVLKNHPKEYDYIINFCNNHFLSDIPFKQKVYHVVNNIIKKIICKNPNCENLTNYKNSTLGYYEYCCNKCISSDPNIKNLKEEKSLKKYGTKTPAESKEIRKKIIKTNNDKYGGNSPMSNINIKNKSKSTLFKNYGVDNPNKHPELIEKRTETFKKNIDSYKESYKKTSIKKYGVEHPWMTKDIHQKSMDNQRKSKIKNIENIIIDKLKDYSGYKLIDVDNTPFKRNVNIICKKGHNFLINREQLYNRHKNKLILCTICNPLYRGISNNELVIFEFIKEFYKGEIIANTREIIKPYEIDIYLPDLNIGFEFNGLFWHSEKFRNSEYHLKKWKISKEVDVNVYSIWEDDWILKEDIVKSFILNKIGKTPNKIYARKCQIKEVSYKESAKFLNENHLQGDCKSSIRIGLYYDDEIVSIMTFSKLRLPLSQKNTDGAFELTRFCNKTYHNIVGGSSKLLNYYKENFFFSEIHTYSDNMISDGNMYKLLGFENTHISNPGYWYLINDKREHRFNWRKHKLVSMGYDNKKTEEEIMSELGFFRIYNAGNKKWLLKK